MYGTCYLYMFGAWLMHLFMVHVEVQVDVWYMLAHVIGTVCYRHDYRLIGIGLQQYISQ
jgi:hypothetical protein